MEDQVFNPFLPECEYLPDGEAHVFDGRVYIYGSHDKFNSMRYCTGDYVAYSAPVDDLTNWRYEGVIYKRRGVKNRLGFKCLWAPDVCRGPDGRYYMYFCFCWRSYICVAVCDTPAGRYKFYGIVRHKNGTPYGKGPDDMMCFDPGVLADENGVYIYSGYSANPELVRMLRMKGIKNVDGTGGQVVRLGRDMLTVEGKPKMLIPGYKNSKGTGFEGHEMYEASSMRKVGNKYYFVYSSRLSHELAYAVSDYPDRDFKYGGAIISNGDIGYNGRAQDKALNYWGNIHGSIENINGQWYVFYHRQTNKTEQSRQACAEKINIDENGHISQVEITSEGLNGKPLSGTGYYPAYIACNLMSANGAIKCAYGPFSKHKYKAHPCVTQEKSGKRKYQYISNMKNGATAGYKYFKIKSPCKIDLLVRGSAGKVKISSSLGGAPVATVKIEASKQWCNASTELRLFSGVTPLYFTYEGVGSIDFRGFTLA